MDVELTVGHLVEFADGELVAVDVGGHALIVARLGDEVHVAANRCPHLGFSLTRGPGGLRYSGGVVQCPWHNSRFDVCTGENLDWVSGFAGRRVPRWSRQLVALGRKPRDLKILPARVEDGRVVVAVGSTGQPRQ
jgi:nitrite reductase/ring-hydroxylating ferredoxin subunit